MLVLSSNGLSSRALTDAVRASINGTKAALVVTADNVYKERNYHVARLAAELRSLGLRVDIFDLDREHPSRLDGYNVIEMMGGNPFYLLHSIRTRGFSDVLERFAQERCIIGCSAGSFVMTRSLELVNIYTPEMNTVGLRSLEALALTQLEVLPHYSRFIRKIPEFESKCREYEDRNGRAVIRLNDGDAVLVSGEESAVVRAQEPENAG